MGLSDEHAGIIEMPADAPLGKPFAEVLGLNDPVFDINADAEPPGCPRRARCRARSRGRRPRHVQRSGQAA
jgi:hypothetical protein